MTKDLYELADKVIDEQSFVDFIIALAEDWEDEQRKEKENLSSPWGPGANGWENGTIGTYLNAAAAWATASINGLPLMAKAKNPWTRAAQILHAGKFYE